MVAAPPQDLLQDGQYVLRGRTAEHHGEKGAAADDRGDDGLVDGVALEAEAGHAGRAGRAGRANCLITHTRGQRLQALHDLCVVVGQQGQTALRDGRGAHLHGGDEEGGDDRGVLLEDGEQLVDVFGLVVGRGDEQLVDDGGVRRQQRSVLLLVLLQWTGDVRTTQMDCRMRSTSFTE